MPKQDRFGINLDVNVGREPHIERPEPDTPFRILVLGDFTGRANRALFDPQLAGRRPVAIDRDNFEQVLEKMAPELCLGGDDQPARVSLRFTELDDFHPDRIYGCAALFQALRHTRERLSDRATFAAAAAALRGETPAPAPEPPKASLAALFEQSLEATETRAEERTSRAVDDFGRLLQEIVRPHLLPGKDRRQEELIAQVDTAIAAEMRACLHDPAFQALEAAWRGMFFLTRRLETGAELRLYLLDISQAELAAAADGDLRSSPLYRLLMQSSTGTPGGQPWAVLAGLFTFEPAEAHAGLLAHIAQIAAATGAPFIAAASPRVLGCPLFGDAPDPEDWQAPPENDGALAWQALRQVHNARSVGLALPRFLLRLPYGTETDAIEQFAFEEFEAAPVHEEYLWGNPALACACLLGQAFSEYGWDFRPGAVLDLDSLPAHTYREDGEWQLKPCAEALLTLETAERILDAGLMPLLSMKGRDCARLARFQSVAEPLAPLAGRWS